LIDPQERTILWTLPEGASNSEGRFLNHSIRIEFDRGGGRGAEPDPYWLACSVEGITRVALKVCTAIIPEEQELGLCLELESGDAGGGVDSRQLSVRPYDDVRTETQDVTSPARAEKAISNQAKVSRSYFKTLRKTIMKQAI